MSVEDSSPASSEQPSSSVTSVSSIERSLTLSHSSASIAIGQRLQLVATLQGSDASLSWSSSNSSVASVSSLGLVEGRSNGKATITVSAEGLSATCAIEVYEDSDSDHVDFDIFAFNDTHGNASDTPGKGIGIAKVTTLLKGLTKDKESVIISQGDMWQGSVESNYTHGLLMTDWMNQLGFASMTVGNHEFDWGQEAIKENIEIAEFPILGINVLHESNHERVDYLQPSATFMRGEAKIGVIGAIGNCLSSISSSMVKGIYFATDSELSNLVKAESKRLREEEQCDFVIYSIHGSARDDEDENYDITLSSERYVDLVLEGHTHSPYCYTDDAGIYHVQSAANNVGFYQLSVDFNMKYKSFDITPKYFDTSAYSSYSSLTPDSETSALFEKYAPMYEHVYRDVGYNDIYRDANALRNLIADLYLEAAKEKWGKDYAIALGGGYLSCRGRGLPAGVVSYSKLAELFPFDNDVVLCSTTAEYFVNTSYYNGENTNYFCSWSEEGKQIRDRLSKGEMGSNELIYLVTDTYNSDYAPNHLTVLDHLAYGGRYARDLLSDYAESGGFGRPLNPETPPSIESHAGTIEDPKTIAEALSLAANHVGSSASNAGSSPYFFQGTLTQAATKVDGYGDLNSLYVGDEGGSSILIYRLKKTADRNLVFSSTADLKVGDVLLFYGAPFTYNGDYNSNTAEFSSGTYLYMLNGALVVEE